MRICIFGAGQAGRMLRVWRAASVKLIGFIDNNPALQGTMTEGVPVLSAQAGIAADPDEIWIAVLNREAEESIARQLRAEGYAGRIRRISDVRAQWDFRLASLRLCAEEIKQRKVPGAVAELGVYQGDFARELLTLFPDRPLYLFDTFEGFPARDLASELERGLSRAREGDFSDTSAEAVLEKLGHAPQVILKPGYFPDTAKGLDERFAFVNIDPDLYEPVLAGLRYFYPRLNHGGYLFVHDYNSCQFQGAGDAVREFCAANDVYLLPLTDLHGTAVILKP